MLRLMRVIHGPVVLQAICLIVSVAVSVNTSSAWGQKKRSLFPSSATRNASTAKTKSPTQQVATEVSKKSAIVAVVNGQTITRPELAQRCLERHGESVLESLVNKHLILEACRAKNVSISRQDIEDEIESIAKRFSLPKERWLEMLQQERNISPEQYRRDIIWPTLALKHLAADQLTVSKEDLQREYQSEYGPKVQVRMIAVEKEAQAKQLLRQVQADPSQFGLLAKKHSQDPNSAAARGLIPPIRKHVGEPEVEQVCFALERGQVSKIVEVAGQYLIFKCEKHLPAAHISPQYQRTAYDRLRQRLVNRKLRTASSDIFEQLQEGATVVNVLNDEQKRKQYPNVASLINGKQIPISTLGEECIERHGVDVLDAEINYVVLQQALNRKSLSVAGKEIDAEVARAAESYGYLTEDRKPDIKLWLQEVTEREGLKVETYVRDAVWPSVALKKLVGDEVTVNDEDLRRGFEANYGTRVDVLACVLSNQRTAQEVWDLARSNPTSQFFAELANQYSVEPVSRANMGEVPPIRRFSGQPRVEEEAFSLTEADPLSAIIAVADRYIVLFYKGRTEPIVAELADVREELVRDIHEKKLRMAMAKEFDRLKESAQIDNYLLKTSQSGGKPQLTTSPRVTGQAPRTSRATAPTKVRPASQRK